MNFDWYQIFNLDEFMALSLVSRNLTVDLEAKGQKEILITRGNNVSLVYEDVMLPILFNNENPYVREGDDASYAVYKDSDSNVWLGIEVEA